MIVAKNRKEVSLNEELHVMYNSVMQYLYNRYRINHIAVCICGAVTFEREQESSWSVSLENASCFFPELPPAFFEMLHSFAGEYSNCNHCINHWGLDLCACGSGEVPEECDGGFTECGLCSQYVKEVVHWRH